MTFLQKEKIKQMRGGEFSYAKIAAALGISENTVKSFCRRNNIGGVVKGNVGEAEGVLCRHCIAPLTHTAWAKQKRFCSDKCRLAWWSAHPEAVRRKAIYAFTCAHCGAAFESYSNKKRKYCSRVCYGKSKGVRYE